MITDPSNPNSLEAQNARQREEILKLRKIQAEQQKAIEAKKNAGKK
jgi:hypothetical protein